MLDNSEIREKLNNAPVPYEEILRQIEILKKGTPYAKLDRAATLGDGIAAIDAVDQGKYLDIFLDAAVEGRFMKFVPASGAASRMFKSQTKILNTHSGVSIDELDKLAETDPDAGEAIKFVRNIKKFAFAEDLDRAMKLSGKSLDELLESGSAGEILDFALTSKGLGLAGLPKGLIKFHKYESESRTAFAEHLVEAAEYVRDARDFCKLHFTLPKSNQETIKAHLAGAVRKFEGADFEIEYSEQDASTDTIAVDLDDEPFVLDSGEILFRPGGHGALLQNLQNCGGDVIFVKNVDNVAPDRLKPDTILYKKLLGGLFVEIQDKIFEFLRKFDRDDIGAEYLTRFAEYAENFLNLDIPIDVKNEGNIFIAAYLRKKLDRPIRVCGMVANEGEPGGGPFFVEGADGEITLQIVEKSQIDTNDENQLSVLNGSTHFNPVDLVCGIKNYKGETFDLHNFADENAVFISKKSKFGRELKALELPGLWNGAMADWTTVFVEVPISTFSPVKTVNDLLRDSHKE